MKHLLRKLYRYYKQKNESRGNHGFTLVELIVVLVILAILAAILVPALLGWIDKSRSAQTLIDANMLIKAIQAETAEAYAEGPLKVTGKRGDNGIAAGSHYPSIRKIMNLLEAYDFGDPGNDWWYQDNIVYNGFGYGKVNPSEKHAAKKHFKCLISKDGQILRLVFCDENYIADYTPEAGFTIKKMETSHLSGSGTNTTMYNYICIGEGTRNVFNGLPPK